MHRHSFFLPFAAAALLLASCTMPSDRAYISRGAPESLLDRSSEVVTLNAATRQDLDDLAVWIGRDLPSRAELNCPTSDANCRAAERMLTQKNVPVLRGVDGAYAVTLVYERIVARDCNPSLRIERGNYYNTNHPGFGCSIAANIVQQVTDKNEIIAPETLDAAPATRAVTTVKRAYTPRPVVPAYTINQGLVNQAASSSSQ